MQLSISFILIVFTIFLCCFVCCSCNQQENLTNIRNINDIIGTDPNTNRYNNGTDDNIGTDFNTLNDFLKNLSKKNQYKIYYYNDTNRMSPKNDIIRSDIITDCPKEVNLCPFNTLALCLINNTIFCTTKIENSTLCLNDTNYCIATVLPCINLQNDIGCNANSILMPCLLNATIIDANADKNGLVLRRIAGTFVLIPYEREILCVTLIAESIKDDNKNKIV